MRLLRALLGKFQQDSSGIGSSPPRHVHGSSSAAHYFGSLPCPESPESDGTSESRRPQLVASADQLALGALLWSDVIALYGTNMGCLSRASRAICNPSIHACVLIRLAQRGRHWSYPIIRRLLLALHGIDVARGGKFGPYLLLPHPTSIVIGGLPKSPANGVVIGSHVRIYHNVTLGLKDGGYPVIGDGVTIYPGAVVVGGITVGAGATIGANVFVDRDIPALHVYVGAAIGHT